MSKKGKARTPSVVHSMRTKRGREAHAQAVIAAASDSTPSEAHDRWIEYDSSDDDDFDDLDGSDQASSDERQADPTQARAATLDGTTNPYGLALDADQVRALNGALQNATLHHLVGAFCALASVPQVVPPESWLNQLLEREPRLANFESLLGQLHADVGQRVETGAITTLVPVAADEAACADWARGYEWFYTLVDRRFRESETVVLRGFEIRVLAGKADALEELEEFPEQDTTEESIALFRERLSVRCQASHLHGVRTPARSRPRRPAAPCCQPSRKCRRRR